MRSFYGEIKSVESYVYGFVQREDSVVQEKG